MASYSKQLVEVAQEWLAANPDPLSPFLNVPGIDRAGDRRAKIVGDLARYDAIANRIPAARPLVAGMHSTIAEALATAKDLGAKEKELERLINETPEPGQAKHMLDHYLHAPLGRWLLKWAHDGYNSFELSADFTAAMLLTDARELDIEAVRLPFRGLLMLIPDGFAVGVEGGHYTKIHIAEIHRADLGTLDVGNQVFDVLEDMDPVSIRRVLDDMSKKFDRPNVLDELGHRGKKLVSKYAADDTLIHVYATDGVRALDTLIDRKGLTWDAFDELPDSVTEDADRQARHALRRIVFGALAYAGAVEHAAEPREPTQKRKPGAARPAPKLWDLGRTVRIGPHLVRAARAGSREVALRLKHRHIVRGHYKNQVHGPARAMRKRIWIMPYWQGPEDGAALVHTYKLDKES